MTEERFKQLEQEVEALKKSVFKLPLDPTGLGALNQSFIAHGFDKFNVASLNLKTGNSVEPHVNGQIVYNENAGTPTIQALIDGVVVPWGGGSGSSSGGLGDIQLSDGAAGFTSIADNKLKYDPAWESGAGRLDVFADYVSIYTDSSSTYGILDIHAGGELILQSEGNATLSAFDDILIEGTTITFSEGSESFVFPATGGTIDVTVSSQRYKKDIRNIEGSAFDILASLTPREFTYKADNRRAYGLIAEEVEKVDPKLVLFNKEGTPESVYYKELTALLLKAVLELKAEITELK
jgi:hypothetical protein